MTPASSPLSALLADCDALGIRLALAGDGGLSIDAPQDALTPDLLARMRAHKADVLALLREEPGGHEDACVGPASNRAPPPESSSAELMADGWPADCVDPDELTPCATCGTLEQWESAAGDSRGLTTGRWRCLRCDPPTAYRRLAELAERIRRETQRRDSARQRG